MSLPHAASPEAVSLAELREMVGRVVGDVRRLHSDNTVLQAKVDAQPATITALCAENQAQRSMLQRQKIQFCEASDGVPLAYASVGEGPPLVKPGLTRKQRRAVRIRLRAVRFHGVVFAGAETQVMAR
jgi:hypothetical protein